MIVQEEEWGFCTSRKRFLRCLSFPLIFQEYGLRTPLPPRLAQNIPPVVVELKPGAISVS
jgi:hypothetical protein